jgi:flavin-dependent thymidylate synthase
MRLLSEKPKVTLTKLFSTPFDNAVATARTCYSSRIITDDDVAKKPDMRDRIARSVYQAGHHTTLQHATFQFAVENVSRQVLWSFFHAHPFYNSEQVSQRYVEVKPGRVALWDLGDDDKNDRYRACVERQMATYKGLLTLLEDAVSDVYFGVFPARRGRDNPRYKNAVKKKCQEMARYVLPVATHAHLYHTVSGLTLHRYHRVASSHDCPTEQRELIEQMVAEVNAQDPTFFRDIEQMLPLEDTHEARLLASLNERAAGNAAQFVKEFDDGLEGKASKLVDMTSDAPRVLGDALREAFGLPHGALSDEEATDLVLDPQKNPYLSESLNLNTLGKATRALKLVNVTFRKRLSHTADSQAQRHRMTPGARPVLWTHIVPGTPDYVTPRIFEHERAAKARERYDAEMQQTWDDIAWLAERGVSPEAWQYLLPNAVSVRFTESGSLLDQHHKWTTRLCYNAQEEIWYATLDEVDQVAEHAPAIGRWLQPPCGIRDRAGTRPTCPEGDRFCGVKVWRQERKDYLRVL